MRTRYVTTIRLDSDRLAKDLEQAASFRYSEAYSDYLIGGPWKNCMLWAPGGDSGDGVVTNYSYDQRPTFTDYGAQLPYLQDLITNTVDLARLNFVRLVPISNTVIIPHRDLLELSDLPEDARNAHRVHIPLVTNDNCFFSEGNTVYRMREGDIWFLDASQIHSVASFSREPRVHLIFDFVDTPGSASLIRVGESGGGIPADRLVTRPPLSDAERSTLRRLADVLTTDTFNEVFGIVIKKHYRFDAGEDFVWDTMTALARECPDPAVLPHTLELRRYFTLERSADEGKP
jgi:hypothetical protein